MADGKKKGRGGKVLLVTLLAVIGLGVAGYMKPDLPLVGPLVTKFFKSGAEGVDKSGLYQVRVQQAAVSPEEFSEGENVDLQVSIERLDADGDATRIWQSWQYGARRAKVGKDSITATWSDRPVEIAWQPGERFVVKLWDLAGI